MPDPTDPQALIAVRWSFARTAFFCAAYVLMLLIFSATFVGLIVSSPEDPLEFGLLPLVMVGIVAPLAALVSMACFFGKILFRNYTIYVAADYRTVCDTHGNLYVAGKHEAIRFAGKPGADFAFFPEYVHQDAPSSPPVTVRPDTWSVARKVLSGITARRFVLPLLFARHRGRIVRGLRSVRP